MTDRKFEVLSDRLAKPKGETITERELAPAHIEALIEGAHLKPTAPATKNKKSAPKGAS